MVHERHHGSAARLASSQPSAVKPESKAAVVLSSMNKDIKALNSSILVLSQKINYIIRNEKILGRNILVLNKKLKELEQSRPSLEAGIANPKEIEQLKEAIEQNAAQLSELYSAVERIRESSVKEEQFKEIKYVIDSINPLEFVTYKDIDRIIEEKLGKAKKAKK